MTDGRILGHEAVGTITEVGEAVKGFGVGDRVLVPAITKCGRCGYCQRGMPSHCQTVGGIGWIFGHLIDGTQAESVRVPYADTSLYAVPAGLTNEQVIGIDTNKFRLEKALEFGATDVVEVGPGTVADVIALTDGLGVDVAIEAVGYPETLLTAASLVRPGGSIANIGVHGTPVELPMQDMWIQNVTLTMGLVDTVSIPTLLTMVPAAGSRPRRWAPTRSRSARSTRPTTCSRTRRRTRRSRSSSLPPDRKPAQAM